MSVKCTEHIFQAKQRKRTMLWIFSMDFFFGRKYMQWFQIFPSKKFCNNSVELFFVEHFEKIIRKLFFFHPFKSLGEKWKHSNISRLGIFSPYHRRNTYCKWLLLSPDGRRAITFGRFLKQPNNLLCVY